MSDLKTKTFTRRDALRLLGAGTAVAGFAFSPLAARAASQAHVVILGGGIGGTTAAKYIRIMNPDVKITLIERNKSYITCPRSNDVVVGFHELDEITFTHDAIASRYKIDMVIDTVTGVELDAKRVHTQGGGKIAYDRLVVSPGIDFKWEDVPGFTPEVAETVMPHAWKAGPQTLLLKRQLNALPQGGRVIIAPPVNPFRCPPGPYERASLIAEWMQRHNPTAKVLILDPKNSFTKDGPFKKAWERLYGFGTGDSMIEWVPGDQGGAIWEVRPKDMTVAAAAGDFKGDVVNVIPPQKAGKLAHDLGLADASGWCPVDRATFKSAVAGIEDVYVIGDATIADDMPKSGYAANSQAKLVAHAIASDLDGTALSFPNWANTCYSLAGSHYGVSISAIYELRDGHIRSVENSGGVSPITDNPAQPRLEAVYQKNWHRTFVKDIFS